MKKILVLALLGVASVATSFGQGHILFSNYLTPTYDQVTWGNSVGSAPGGQENQAVRDYGLQFQMFYAEGVITDSSLLTAGATFTLSDAVDFASFDPGYGHGAGGYFAVTQVLPSWASGDTFTFMYKVITPGYFGESSLWQESNRIVSTEGSPLSSVNVPGLTVSVPEPSTLALAGLGSAALLIFRRRK